MRMFCNDVQAGARRPLAQSLEGKRAGMRGVPGLRGLCENHDELYYEEC